MSETSDFNCFILHLGILQTLWQIWYWLVWSQNSPCKELERQSEWGGERANLTIHYNIISQLKKQVHFCLVFNNNAKCVFGNWGLYLCSCYFSYCEMSKCLLWKTPIRSWYWSGHVSHPLRSTQNYYIFAKKATNRQKNSWLRSGKHDCG